MQSWIIYALLSALCAALVAVFGKIGIEKIDSTLATTVRAIIMAALLVAVAAATRKFAGLGQISGKGWLFIVLSGAAGAVSWLFYFIALKKGPAAGVAGLDRLSVVFVVILAALLLGEKLTLRSGAGAVLLTIGAVLLAWK